MGHVMDHLLGASNVFHFSALDTAEASLDVREGRQRTGEAVFVDPDELKKRATALVADPIFRDANCIGEHFSRLSPSEQAIADLEMYLNRATSGQLRD